ncbi:uncharacterized protein LOC131005801 [Salvia miltiorrhiza]|uniref:uncharacterized protein LOC131005801 n=1 Tax=Salvia miltiorrhiza TaxID=226208 RepID=UPI0025AC4FB8|nr:uncharacterized protein LOC131005801 [Salvia miltiorrhiza]XP_057788871.1 uncharacterized protein LOC131005801 [Salvia miltiorrhiza]
MGEIKRSFDTALAQQQQQKLCFSDKVCIVCRVFSGHGDCADFKGYLIFVVDLSELVNGSKKDLQYNILLNYGLSTSVCGLDSTLYLVESLSCSESRKVHTLDVVTKHQCLKLRAKHLGSLPPMFGTKRFALIASIPSTKKILVFSSQFKVFMHTPNLADDDDGFGGDSDEDIDFEMYDVGTNTWEKLPPLIILKVYGNGNFTNPSFFLLHGAEETEIPRNAWDEDFGIYEISRYTLIDEDVFLVQLTCGIMLTLDLKSPSKGWKLCDEGMVTKPSSDQNLFVINEKTQMPWCAYDIRGDRKFGNAVAFPLSSFSEDDPLKDAPDSTITLLEGDKAKGHVCIMQGGVSRKSKHPQMVMDVGNVQGEVVASCRFEVPHRIKDFAPICMFVCHPKQRMGVIKRSLDGAVVQHQQKLCFSDKVCFVCRVFPRQHDFRSSGHLIFVVDLSELVNGSEKELQYNYHLNYGFGMSACGLDSTLYFVQFSGWTMSRTVHTLDVETKHQGLKLGADDLGSLPPMLGPKRSAQIASIPRTKKILVFSTEYRVFFHNPNLAGDNNDDVDVSIVDDDDFDDDDVVVVDDVFDDDDDHDEFVEFVDFEMYDIGTNTWEKLHPPIFRKSYGGNNPYFFLLHGAEETEIPRNAWHADFEFYDISRSTFINEDVFLVQLTCGIKLTLDLKSPSKGWKLYDEGMVIKPSSDQDLFIVNERSRVPWCASDIGGDGKFGNAVAFPLSSFSEDDPVKPHPLSTITSLESDEAKGHVCILQGGVSRKSRHLQLVMDVGNVQGEVVASCRFKVPREVKWFEPFSMFVYHPKQSDTEDQALLPHL